MVIKCDALSKLSNYSNQSQIWVLQVKHVRHTHRFRQVIQDVGYFPPDMGLQLGYWFFFGDLNNRDCQVLIYCSLSMTINTREMQHNAPALTRAYAQRSSSRVHFVYVCSHVGGWQGPKYPQLELHSWQCNYTGWFRESGIFGLNLWV